MPFNCGVGEDSWESLGLVRRFNQSILKEISPEYSLEGLMVKLKFQHFGQLMQRTDSLAKTWCWEILKAGEEGDNRGWDGWMASLTWWTWVEQAPGVGDGQGSLVSCSPWGRRVGHNWATELNCTNIHLIVSNHIKEYYYKYIIHLFKIWDIHIYVYIKSPNKVMFNFLICTSRILLWSASIRSGMILEIKKQKIRNFAKL